MARARRLRKPILKLTDEDFNEHGLQELLTRKRGCAQEINIDGSSRACRRTITGWPGGKPGRPKLHRRARVSRTENPRGHVHPKRVVVFSPHPDDDVISMGGTFMRLCEQGHEVHVAYQTSGNIAVFDDEALRHTSTSSSSSAPGRSAR